MSKVEAHVKNRLYATYNERERVLPVDSAVEEIIQQENSYKRELWRLLKILRRSMSTEDPLPIFNRRHLLILLKRFCKDMEYSTSRMNKNMDMWRLSHVLEMSTQVPHNLLCVAYSDALYEMREFLRRETIRRSDNSICYCTEIHAERALLPLHRLKYLKALSCFSQQHKDSISTALDGCFEVLASLHSPNYVSEVDNLLDLSLVMRPPPTFTYENVWEQNDYNEIVQFNSIEETKDDHDYEEIELVPLKPSTRKLTDIFFNNNKKYAKNSLFSRNRFSVSTTELCS